MRFLRPSLLGLLSLVSLSACAPADASPGPLRINEIVAANDGVWVDEAGETDDWVELVNTSPDTRIWLDDYSLGEPGGPRHRLPALPLAPGERILFWADDDLEQGDLHLPFKLSSGGEGLVLRDRQGRVRDRVEFPPLAVNEAFARFPDGVGELTPCRYPSPDRDNTDVCGLAAPPPSTDMPFEDYEWPESWPSVVGPLVLTELALAPASFIEIDNRSDATVLLADYEVRLAPHGPGVPWPTNLEGVALPWPVAELGPGERVVVSVTADDVAAVAATEHFEGVVSVFEVGVEEPVDRVDFMAWPRDSVLARHPSANGLVHCIGETPGEANDECEPLDRRELPGRARHLRTPGDFEALAAGGTALGVLAVKVVVDMDSGDVVHLLGASAWELHYTFVREAIELEEPLDRCIPEENALFHLGWGEFSREQYTATDTRRYLLATLTQYVGASEDLQTLEFVTGDHILPEQMHRGFFAVASHVPEPTELALRPQSDEQDDKLRSIEGTVPVVTRNAPFTDQRIQPLNAAVGFGVLRFIPGGELAGAPLGQDVIVVTDDVPNGIALVGGLITEAFQTPLAHVNVLSRGRSTPNMGLRDARSDPTLTPLFESLVRFEVHNGGYSLGAASAAEAEAFWASRRPTGPRIAPRVDATVRGVQPLASLGIDATPAIGAKAAQLAELGRVDSRRGLCLGDVRVPVDAFALPVAHYFDHFAASGAQAELERQVARAEFRADPNMRGEGLRVVRELVLSHPVDAGLLVELEEAIRTRFGTRRVRLRSSSNTEDLQEFNGAGLYTSQGAELEDDRRRVDDSLRTVWASLWTQRAYDEREMGNIEQSSVAMGVLVHEAFRSEAVNGVGVSRNIFDPNRGDMHYFNVQVGEANVANPAPGITSDEYLYRFGRSPRVVYQQRSTLTRFDIMSVSESDVLACTLAAVHDHFQELIDPELENRWFAMDIEFKLVGADRNLVVKQARPYSFGSAEPAPGCIEF